MPLLDRVQKDMVLSMKARDEGRLSTLRMMKTALKKHEVDAMKPLDEAAEMQILKSLVKQPAWGRGSAECACARPDFPASAATATHWWPGRARPGVRANRSTTAPARTSTAPATPPDIPVPLLLQNGAAHRDRKSTRLNSSHLGISYAVFCLKKKHSQTSHHSALIAILCPLCHVADTIGT